MNKRSVGSIYEQLAAEQLINMGYSVLACNYRNRFGEIDIIAKDVDTRYYLMKHGLDEWTPCRFDVIAVDDDEVTVLKNAFEGSQ